MSAERHGLCGGLSGLGRPGHASDVTANAVVRVAAQTAARAVFDHRRLGGQDAAAPDAAAAPSVVVIVLAVLRGLVVVLVVGVLVVHNLVVVMVVLVPLDVVPYLECVGQRVDHGHDQELAHQYRLDGHKDHLDLLLEQVDTE